ncbi:MAG: methyltransferase domain-containing protein [Actinomycetia bacterium]|nr:methyltransferase domain-containing protein [Actinomycetes bacterium]
MQDNSSHYSRQTRYTHGHAPSVVGFHATRSVADSFQYGVARLAPGQTVLDVGCGPGSITVDLARIVAPGRVIAIDQDAGVLSSARSLAAAQGADNVEFAVMDAASLDLPDSSVDVVHAHQVLQHVPDPVTVLKEMARVTRPGGVIAARDGDYSAFTWFPPHPGLDEWRRLYVTIARRNGGEPDAGRHLLAWAHAAGLTDVVATSSTSTYAAGEGARAWGAMWAERILHSGIGTQLIEAGLASQDDLSAISAAWLEWSRDPDAFLFTPHGEILAAIPG